MKCPRCGHWNQASFPRCFQCGEPLHAKDAKTPGWQERFEKPQAKKQQVLYDDAMPPEADIVPEEAPLQKVEPDESLALEMNKLKERRERGSRYLEAFRQNAAEKGIAPSGTGVSIRRAGGFFTEAADEPEEAVYAPPEIREQTRAVPPRPKGGAALDRDALLAEDEPFVALSGEDAAWDDDLPPAYNAPPVLAPKLKRRKKRRVYGPMAVALWAVRLLVVAAVAFIGWQGVLLARSLSAPPAPTQEADVSIEAFTMDDGFTGHRILISGEDGTQVYVSELTKSFIVVDGVATIEVADYFFYDAIEPLEIDQMTVTLTPTMIRGANETRLTPITYPIDIPMSPLRIIKPETSYVPVSTSIYGMELEVEPGSKVTVNGKSYTDSVNEEGKVYPNPPVQAIGDNVITITVKAPHCRENNQTVTFYREVQEIPLELAADTTMSTRSEEFTIYATTQKGATVNIESPYFNLNDSKLDVDGTFSFSAKMGSVGYNTVRIRSSYPGLKDSVLEHLVYYLPTEDIYTKKAWAFTRKDYTELLANIGRRTKDAQIYVCKGVIKEILSNKPQLAIMDAGADGQEQLVLLQNETQTQWELGKTYRIYADVSGLYNEIPKMIARYTYTN